MRQRPPPCYVALFLCLAAHSAGAAEPIVGAFEVKLGKPANSAELRLECVSESSCIFTYIAKTGNEPPAMEKKVLNNVRPVSELTQAEGALKYAIGQRALEIRHEEYSEVMRRLRPVLAANPSVAKCWDLNYSSPDYLLACTLSGAPPGSPPLYLFGTLLASCGEAFCRFVIYPMSRVK